MLWFRTRIYDTFNCIVVCSSPHGTRKEITWYKLHDHSFIFITIEPYYHLPSSLLAATGCHWYKILANQMNSINSPTHINGSKKTGTRSRPEIIYRSILYLHSYSSKFQNTILQTKSQYTSAFSTSKTLLTSVVIRKTQNMHVTRERKLDCVTSLS
jgi:hypothetical protein